MDEEHALPNALEYSVIGNFIESPEYLRKMRKLAKEHGIKPIHFTDPALRTAFELLMASESENITALRSDLITKCTLDVIDKACLNHDIDIVDAALNLRKLRDRGYNSEFRQIVNEQIGLFGENSNPMFVATAIWDAMRHTIECKDDSPNGISLADLANPKPEEEDPDCLFKGGYLKKGGALVMTSVSGSGKSVITMQLSYAWAMGKPMFGITPLRPMRIGIFQTEDDDQELAEFRANMRNGFERFCEWTPEEWKKAEKQIYFHNTQGKTGADFAQLVRDVQSNQHYDLVIINPLQGVTGFDISKNADLSNFLRTYLDGVIKGEETKCGLLIVHHTNKPPSARERNGFGSDQFAEYVGAGGAELTNWMRAMLTIMPCPGVRGVYKLVAAKRGKRLDWPDIPQLKSSLPIKLIRHSTRDEKCLFWHEIDAEKFFSDDGEGDGQSSSKKSDKPDVKTDAKTLAEKLKATAMTKTEARNAAKKLFGAKHGNEVYNEMMDDLDEYGLTKKNTGNGSQCLIGSAESVKNRFSELPGGKTDE